MAPARLAAPLALALTLALGPSLAIAQQAAGGRDPAARDGIGFAWLWVIAAVAVLFFLAWTMFGRGARARREGPPQG
jgi:hypothetical protein